MLVALSILACAGTPADPEADTDAALPASFDYESDPVGLPEVDREELEAALQGAIDSLYTLHPEDMLDAYFALIEAEPTDPCPGWIEVEGSEYWIDECETAGGTAFSGWAYHQALNEVEYEGVYTIDHRFLSALAWVTEPDGDVFECSGNLIQSERLGSLPEEYGGGESHIFTAEMEGMFRWDGAEPGGWASAGLAPDTRFDVSYSEVLNHVTILGGVSGLEGPFDAIYWYNFTYVFGDTPCPEEGLGTIGLRIDGDWLALKFTGPSLDQAYTGEHDDASCDGCAAITWRGQESGQLCADFSSLALPDGESPW